MRTRCVRYGQVEIGIIENEGREFWAIGATVRGLSITGYTKLERGHLTLTDWCGKTTLACRSEIPERFAEGSCTVVFSLTKGRFVVGYALCDTGMLFRGELLTDSSLDEARRTALALADKFAEIDAEDEAEME